MTLPLAARNRLAELILESLHDARARRGLEAMAGISGPPSSGGQLRDLPAGVPDELCEVRDGLVRARDSLGAHEAALAERSRRAWQAVRHRPLDSVASSLPMALSAAARLFDSGLYFEVHELLEPHWVRAAGSEREALQGLIQVAVGFEHLANGNRRGARALLRDGSAKLAGRTLEGLDLDSFAGAARRCGAELGDDPDAAFDWSAAPVFPARPRHG